MKRFLYSAVEKDKRYARQITRAARRINLWRHYAAGMNFEQVTGFIAAPYATEVVAQLTTEAYQLATSSASRKQKE
jgi:hypothetical protein